jgi:hypothetical protein
LRKNGYSVVGEKKSPQSSHQGYVSERDNRIVCKINGIVLVLQKQDGESVVRWPAKPDVKNAILSDLGDTKIFDCRDLVACSGPRQLSAIRSRNPAENQRVPRRSSWRSLSGFKADGAWAMSSGVSFMALA